MNGDDENKIGDGISIENLLAQIDQKDLMDNIDPNLLQQLMSKSKDEPDSKNFKKFIPEPGFCLKSRDDKDTKIFLNICHSDEIQAPKDIDEATLLKIIETEDSAFNYRIPMSLGEPHAELDNSGCDCTAYDVCINPEFFQKINTNPRFMGFFISVVLDGLDAKYSIKIDRNCKMLKNKKFMGSIKEQFIRVKSKPLIAEVNQDSGKQETENKSLKGAVPKYKIIKEPADGEAEFLVAEIQLPDIMFANSLILRIGGDRLVLETRSGVYYLDIYLPYELKQDECGAQFDKKTKLLTITMPVEHSFQSS